MPRAGPDRQTPPGHAHTLAPPRPRPQHARRPQRGRSPHPEAAALGASALSAFLSWSLPGPAWAPQVASSRPLLRFLDLDF